MNRFECILLEQRLNPHSSCDILRDTTTGVNYLFVHGVNGISGLTPLLDKDGKPIVT